MHELVAHHHHDAASWDGPDRHERQIEERNAHELRAFGERLRRIESYQRHERALLAIDRMSPAEAAARQRGATRIGRAVFLVVAAWVLSWVTALSVTQLLAIGFGLLLVHRAWGASPRGVMRAISRATGLVVWWSACGALLLGGLIWLIKASGSPVFVSVPASALVGAIVGAVIGLLLSCLLLLVPEPPTR